MQFVFDCYFYITYHYSFPVNILLVYILSLLSHRRFFFSAFAEQNAYVIGITSLSYSLF